jgi:hypothetical protein
MLRAGAGAAAGLLARGAFDAAWASLPEAPAATAATARSVIQVWMWGGPCHIDTFDPKPEAGYDYCGPFTNPTATAVAGMRLGELLPLLAKDAEKFSIIRSLTHGVNAHETASYLVQTGRPSGDRQVFPSVGAVVSLFKGYGAGYTGLVPPYVVVTEPQGRFSEAGFLGVRYKPFATGGDPAQSRFVVEGVVAPGISDQRQRDRRELRRALDTFGRAFATDPAVAELARAEEQAYELILGDAGKVFDLAQEPEALRDRYGRNTFGQSCLLARRLVERGVPYVTINDKGWDTHKQHFPTMRRKLPELDRGLAALLGDLSERGLLATTVVWCGGEFGRTPRVQWEAPWNGGRGHHGRAFSALVAGGGFQGGRVLGATDARGEEVTDRPVSPAELVTCLYQRLGIDLHARLPHPEGRAVEVAPATDAARAALAELL